MATWVVVLEAVIDEEARTGIHEDELLALGEVLAHHFPVIAGTGWSYETELWVEDNMASGALLTAERLVQAAARQIGLATSEIVRVDIRNAHAIESGVIDWGAAPGARLGIESASPAKKAARAQNALPAGKATPAKKRTAKTRTAKKRPAKKAPAARKSPAGKAAATKGPDTGRRNQRS